MKIRYQRDRLPIRRGAAVLMRRLLLSWLAAAAMEFLLSPGDLTNLSTIAAMSPARMLVVMGVILAALQVLPKKLALVERWLMAGAFAVLAFRSLLDAFTIPYFMICLLMFCGLLVYVRRGWNFEPTRSPIRPAERRDCRWLAAAIGGSFFLFVSIWTVCRIWSFSTPTYDFTIFAQMFHNMKETGLPITTVERDGALSHFAVHVSPIYYLLLPFYCLWPWPATLQVLQAAVLASALIPLWKLGRHHGLAPGWRCLLCLVLVLYPAYSGGTSYDIHENAFLTPLILWLFYGLERRSVSVTAISAVLTCMVKEDAAVYVAILALWQLLRGILRRDCRWNLAAGMLMLAGSLAWFGAATAYLANSGDGVMTYRYGNFMYDGTKSLVSVVKAVLLCPMKAVYECVDAQKLEFLGLTMIPLLGLPLRTRRYERLVLLIPYLLLNLMSDYQYQHNIFFQYTFGSTACLIYLVLVNLADLEKGQGRRLSVMAAVAALCFVFNVWPKAMAYPQRCVTYQDSYAQRRDLLAQIPDGASVAATTFYTTPMSNREILYDIKYASVGHILDCDYVVVSLTDTTSFKKYGSREAFLQFLDDNGYGLLAQLENQIGIYHRSIEKG